MNYIDIEKELIPYQFDIDISEVEYTIEVNYNERYDFFTLDLYLEDEALRVGEKMVLNQPVFEGLTQNKIIPRDRAGIADRITYDNLNETVFLFVE